jgi:hypothetical protein
MEGLSLLRLDFPARPQFRRVMLSVRLQLAGEEVLWEDLAEAGVSAGAVPEITDKLHRYCFQHAFHPRSS